MLHIAILKLKPEATEEAQAKLRRAEVEKVWELMVAGTLRSINFFSGEGRGAVLHLETPARSRSSAGGWPRFWRRRAQSRGALPTTCFSPPRTRASGFLSSVGARSPISRPIFAQTIWLPFSREAAKYLNGRRIVSGSSPCHPTQLQPTGAEQQ